MNYRVLLAFFIVYVPIISMEIDADRNHDPYVSLLFVRSIKNETIMLKKQSPYVAPQVMLPDLRVSSEAVKSWFDYKRDNESENQLQRDSRIKNLIKTGEHSAR